MSDKPFAQSCSNPGMEDHFTCPGCYQDHVGAPSSITRCTKCGRPLHCYVDSQPVAVCELAEPEQDEAE